MAWRGAYLSNFVSIQVGFAHSSKFIVHQTEISGLVDKIGDIWSRYDRQWKSYLSRVERVSSQKSMSKRKPQPAKSKPPSKKMRRDSDRAYENKIVTVQITTMKAAIAKTLVSNEPQQIEAPPAAPIETPPAAPPRRSGFQKRRVVSGEHFWL